MRFHFVACFLCCIEALLFDSVPPVYFFAFVGMYISRKDKFLKDSDVHPWTTML